MNKKMRIIIENNKMIIMNFMQIIKIENNTLLIDNLFISGNHLQISEIIEGSIKIYGKITKIEFNK